MVLEGGHGSLNGFDPEVIKLSKINKFLEKESSKNKKTMINQENIALQHILQTQDEINKSSELLNKEICLNKKLLHPYQKNNFACQVKLPQHAKLLSQLSYAINTLQ